MNPDITTEEGKKQAESGSSALSRYLQEMHEYQKVTMEKLYSNTIDLPCNLVCELDESDFFTNCRQPLSFFQKHHDTPHDSHNNGEGQQRYDGEHDEHLPPPGAYAVQTTCEYCGASHIRLCSPTCCRPKLFLRKQRPPFCSNPERWDPLTEYEIEIVSGSGGAAAADGAADGSAVVEDINTLSNPHKKIGEEEDKSSQLVNANHETRSDPNDGSFNSITSEMPLAEVIVIDITKEKEDPSIPLHQHHNTVKLYSGDEVVRDEKRTRSRSKYCYFLRRIRSLTSIPHQAAVMMIIIMIHGG
ncbi:hypothetical protein MHU86_10948 [Fragilaria crotonensis]|nr:hypothetical protein MHU86_10948 [Fragilaria crotonensis]